MAGNPDAAYQSILKLNDANLLAVMKELEEKYPDRIGGPILEKLKDAKRNIRNKSRDFGRLCDYFLSCEDRMKTRQSPEAVQTTLRIITDAPKYVLDEKVLSLIEDVSTNSPKSAFIGVQAPAGVFWVETPKLVDGGWSGFLWCGKHPEAREYTTENMPKFIEDGSLTDGQLVLVNCDDTGGLFTYTVRSVIGESWIPGSALRDRIYEMPIESQLSLRESISELIRIFWAFCMLITSPKTYVSEEVSMGKVNKSRIAARKQPLQDYTRIKLSVSGPVSRRGNVSSSGGGGGESHGKKLHFVGHFWRTRLGRIEFVRPHWRGNAELGVSNRTKRITA